MVQPIPQTLSAPEAPMPKTAIEETAAPVTTTKPKANTKKAKPKVKKPARLETPKPEITEISDISKSFAVTLNFPAQLFLEMTKEADQYGVDPQTFLKTEIYERTHGQRSIGNNSTSAPLNCWAI